MRDDAPHAWSPSLKRADEPEAGGVHAPAAKERREVRRGGRAAASATAFGDGDQLVTTEGTSWHSVKGPQGCDLHFCATMLESEGGLELQRVKRP